MGKAVEEQSAHAQLLLPDPQHMRSQSSQMVVLLTLKKLLFGYLYGSK